MISKYDESFFYRKNKNKFKISSANKLVNPKNLKNHHLKAKLPRTSSAINFPPIFFDINDSINSHNSTGFSFKNIHMNKNNNTNINKSNANIGHLLNINSIEDFIGKNKDPLEKQKILYEEMKEEKLRIKNILSNLISLDNEIESKKIIKNKKGKKDLNKISIDDNKKKIKLSKTMNDINSNSKEEYLYDNSNKTLKFKENDNKKVIYDGLKIMKGKLPIDFIKEMRISKNKLMEEKRIKLTKLKFSVFDKDYDPKIDKYKIKNEKDFKNEEEEKINSFRVKHNLLELQKEQRKIEISHREEIATIYKNIIINKIKKEKFTEVLDETYKLLDKARIEYSLSVDILKERIKSVQKYYNAYIIAVDKLTENKKGYSHKSQSNSGDTDSEVSKRNKTKKSGLDIYEEKMKRYREYLAILEDINKEIKNYDDKFGLIQDELNTLLKTSSERINQLTKSSRELKYIFKELNTQQIQYYLNLLKKGNDTRTEGLSWIVQRLMELNIQVDSSMFPGFLDQEQIEYIIQISKLSFELVQLKQILDSIRNNQDNDILKDRKFLGFENKEIKDYEQKIKQIKFFSSDLNNLEELFKNSENCKSFKSIDKLKNITPLESDKSDFKNKVLQNYLEEIFIKSLIKHFKRKLNPNNNKENSFNKENSENKNLINFLLVKDKNKDYYKDIIILSKRIHRLNDFIKKMKKEEFLIFEEKFKFGIKNDKTKNFYNKVFQALFGSSSFDFCDLQKINLYNE